MIPSCRPFWVRCQSAPVWGLVSPLWFFILEPEINCNNIEQFGSCLTEKTLHRQYEDDKDKWSLFMVQIIQNT
jgi:hypothetical protein